MRSARILLHGGARRVAVAALAALCLGAPLGMGGEPPPPTPRALRGAGESTMPSVAARPDRRRALACWRRLVDVDLGEGAGAELAQRSVDRLFRTAHGVWLATTLCEVLGTGDGAPARIRLSFVRTLPAAHGDGAAWFGPPRAGARRYDVLVRNPPDVIEPDTLAFGEYPANPACAIVFLYREPESWLAQSVYHELLHLWFVNAFAGHLRRFPTGHGDPDRCQLEPEFRLLLDAFARELAALEGVQPVRLLPFDATP